MNKRRAVVDLFLVSALGLYIELIFIRWAASELRLLAFYKNFALIAAFLGLGLGFALRRRADAPMLFEKYQFPLLAAAVLGILLLGRTPLSEIILLNRGSSQEFIWAGQLKESSPQIDLLLDLAFYVTILALFVIISLLFIPLGEITARKFAAFRPLPGYTINVLGSLAGILVYTLISYLGWPPPIWFLLGAAVGIYLIGQTQPRFYLQAGLALLPIALTAFWPTGADQTLWSPYYRIDLTAQYAPGDRTLKLGDKLSVNQAWHQRMWNLDPAFVQANYEKAPQHFDLMRLEYDTPYQVARRLDEVLIVGAGSGNDAAAALRQGARHVVAVDIDPLILRIGQEQHPEKPYADPRVTLVNQDARSFFRRLDRQYDLIVFGLLDSHTLFSTASSVRLDNFVYTVESLQDVRRLLKEDGLLALLFGVPAPHDWVRERLYRTLTDAFGHPPQVYLLPSETILFLIGPQPLSAPLIQDPRVQYLADFPYRSEIDPVTDDWPYLYLQKRTIPNTYIIGLLGALLISFLLIRRLVPDFRQVSWHFFFMGTAFFLLETKSVTEMALLFGSTWIVNAAVIAAILFMIVCANLIVERFQLKDPRPFYWLLAAALLFDYFVPVSTYLGLSLSLRILLACLAQAIPLFFAGLIFAITFSQTDSIANALGSNLVGSVLGGAFEYSSLVFGIRSLYLIALVFYALAALALRKPRSAAKPALPA